MVSSASEVAGEADIALRIGEGYGQRPLRPVRFIQGQLHNLLADIVRDVVPYSTEAAGVAYKAGLAKGPVSVVPPVNRRAPDAHPCCADHAWAPGLHH